MSENEITNGTFINYDDLYYKLCEGVECDICPFNNGWGEVCELYDRISELPMYIVTINERKGDEQ